MSVLKMTEQDTWGTSEEGLLLAGHQITLGKPNQMCILVREQQE